MKKLALMLSILLLGLAVAVPGARAKPQRKKKMPKPYRQAGFKEARFTCEVPADWKELPRDQEEDAEEKIYEVVVAGPKGKEGIAPLISASYYAPGNMDFDDAGQYLKVHQDPGLNTIEGQKTSKPQKTLVAGKPATAFSHDTFEYYPPRSIKTKEIKMREDHVVLAHGRGFFALKLAVPAAEHKRWRPAFDHVLKTFRPAKPDAQGKKKHP